MVSLAGPVALVISLAAVHRAEPTPLSTTQVDIRGIVARVTVDRVASLGSLRTRSGAKLSVFDLAVPQGAQHFSIRVSDLGVPTGDAVAVAQVPTDVAASLRASPPDPSALVRVVLQGGRERDLLAVRYAYTVPLSCHDGFWELVLPGAVDLAPTPGALTVGVSLPPPLRLAEVKIGAMAFAARGSSFKRSQDVGSQTANSVGFRLHHQPGQAGATAMAGIGADSKAVVGVCRFRPQLSAKRPTVVLALIDTSSSIGSAGLSQQRSFVRSFLGYLPGATKWNAITFDRFTTTLFGLPRLVTQETLGLFDQALVPGRLANGTDLQGGLTALRREFTAARLAEPTATPWVLLISDGSVPDGTSVRRLREAAAGGMLGVPIASVIMRGELEDPPAPGAVKVFADLASHGAGAFRFVRAANVTDQAKALVADLQQGGDWFDVRLQGRSLAGQLAPGAGVVTSLGPSRGALKRSHALKRSQVDFRHAGRDGFVGVNSVRLPAGWSRGTNSGPPLTSQVALPSGALAWVLPLPQPAAERQEGGTLERSVLRNALSLAFLPRARACYLNRSATNARMRDLQGRVRLVLELERGEVLTAKVASSTLDAPEIEQCLTEAAFSLQIPRPVLNDAPVEAVLNLVFRPSTVQPPTTVDASAFDQELEVLLGPRRALDDVYSPDADEGN